jgi:hypothetical protein
MVRILSLSLLLMALAAPAPAEPVKGLVQIDFVFDNRVGHTRDLPTYALQAARKRMVSGGRISTRDLQQLADAGDGLAAFRFAKLLEVAVPPPKLGITAHYYAMAAYTGRSFAVAPLARLLVAEGEGYTPSLLKQGLNAMTIQAISGNDKAAQLLGQMYSDGKPFGKDLGQAQHFLAMAGQSDPGAALKLGIAMMSDPGDASLDHVGARSALDLAASGDDLSARVTAENLLRLLDTPATPAEKAAP